MVREYARYRDPRVTCLSLECPERVGGRCVWDRSGQLTSEKWHELTKKTEAVILKPTGWGEFYKTYWYNKKIPYSEYVTRREQSECRYNPEFVKMELELAEMTHTKPQLPDSVIAENLADFKPKNCILCGEDYKVWHECST